MILRSFALAAAGILMAQSAAAINALDIVWRGAGTSIGTPTVSNSVVLVADFVLTADTNGISGVGFSVAFDAAELQYVSGTEFTSVNLPGMGNIFNPLALGVTVDNTNGVITAFDQADLSGVGLVNGTVTLGSMKFHVGSLANDSMDVDILANSNGLADGFVDSVGGQLANPVVFSGASVVPEAGAASLGAIALATLLALKRRRS